MDDFIVYKPTETEFRAIRNMMKKQNLSEQALIRQSLRLYNEHLNRLENGETVHYSGDAERARAFAGGDLDGVATSLIEDELED